MVLTLVIRPYKHIFTTPMDMRVYAIPLRRATNTGREWLAVLG